MLVNGIYRVKDKIEKELNTIADTRSGVNETNGEQVDIALSLKVKSQQSDVHFKTHQNLSNYNTSLSPSLGVPKVYYFGNYDKGLVIVSEKVGQNLHEYFNSKGNTMKKEIIADIAVKLIDICETFHNKDLLIRLICPEVFSLDKNNTLKKLYLTDFRLCKTYKTNNKHITMRKQLSPVGIARYASISVGLGKEYGRRDDLEAIGYILIYFAKNGRLPWMGMEDSGPVIKIFEKISRAKLFTPIELLCEGLDKPFAEFIRYVRTLEFEEQPDYTYAKQGFYKLIGK